MRRLANEQVWIVDDGVYSKTESVALSKNAFAEAVAGKETGFEGIDYAGFKPVFDVIEKILTSRRSPSAAATDP
jgi:hypothetical protein